MREGNGAEYTEQLEGRGRGGKREGEIGRRTSGEEKRHHVTFIFLGHYLQWFL